MVGQNNNSLNKLFILQPSNCFVYLCNILPNVTVSNSFPLNTEMKYLLPIIAHIFAYCYSKTNHMTSTFFICKLRFWIECCRDAGKINQGTCKSQQTFEIKMLLHQYFLFQSKIALPDVIRFQLAQILSALNLPVVNNAWCLKWYSF